MAGRREKLEKVEQLVFYFFDLRKMLMYNTIPRLFIIYRSVQLSKKRGSAKLCMYIILIINQVGNPRSPVQYL